MKTILSIAAAVLALGIAYPALAEVKTIRCGAEKGDERVCELPKKTQQVMVSRQLSKKDCTRGKNWDVRKKSGHDELWARNGCIAEFTVRYD